MHLAGSCYNSKLLMIFSLSGRPAIGKCTKTHPIAYDLHCYAKAVPEVYGDEIDFLTEKRRWNFGDKFSGPKKP